MRFSSVVSFAIATSPATVFAAGNLGFALGVNNPDGSCKSQSDFENDFDALKPYSTIVRTYSASDCNSAENIIPAAKNKGFKVVLGVWPDVPETFDADKEALQKVVPGNEDLVSAITVGSETLYRGNFTGPELLGKIQEVQNMFPKTQVGTADSWNKYADGTADALVTGGVKYFLVNAFAYWQAQDIGNATATYFDDTMQAINHIQNLAGSDAGNVYIATGETGWPGDGGSDYGAAKAGTNNEETFYKQGVCGMLAWGVDVFYFEAFDETWKPVSTGDNGNTADERHWGMFGADRQPKFEISC